MNENQKFFTEELERMKNARVISSNDYNYMIYHYREYLNRLNHPVPVNAPEVAQTTVLPEKPIPVYKATPVPSKHKEFSLGLLFTIGISLILLSSIILIVSTWNAMSNNTKMMSLIIFDLAFFATAFIVQKYLKLSKTSFAFWNLGVLFLPVIIIAIGYFGLINDYLSLQGEGCYLYLGTAFLLITPALLYSMIHYRSPLYLIITMLDLLWVALAFCLHFDFAFKTTVFIWSIMLSGLILFRKQVPDYGRRVYDIALETLLYLLPLLDLIPVNKGIFGVLIYGVGIINLVLYYLAEKRKYFEIVFGLLAYGLLLSVGYNFDLGYDANLHRLLVVVIMMALSLWLVRLKKYGWLNLTVVIGAYALLLYNLIPAGSQYHELISCISGYAIVLITLGYLLLGKNKTLLSLSSYSIIFLFLFANLNSYSLINDLFECHAEVCLVMVPSPFFEAYSHEYHFLASVIVVAAVYLAIRIKNEKVQGFSYGFCLILMFLGMAMIPISYRHAPSSVLVNSILYVASLGVIAAMIFRFMKERRHIFALRTGALLLLLLTLIRSVTYLLKMFNFIQWFISFIILIIMLGFVVASYLKSRYQKPLLIASMGAELISLDIMLSLTQGHMGNVPSLFLYILIILLLTQNFYKSGNKGLAYVFFVFIYVFPMLPFDFFYNKTLCFIITSIIFYLFSLSQVIGGISFENNRLSIVRRQNTYLTYMSFGIMGILILRSLVHSDIHPLMIALTAFLPVSFAAVAYNESVNLLRRLARFAILLSLLIPYWYVISRIDFITDHYPFEFIFIPVILTSIISYFWHLKEKTEWSLVLIPFLGLSLFFLITNYAFDGEIVHGLIVVLVTIGLIIGGFFKRNLVILLSGTIGLVFSIFVIISKVWEESPWWLYLLLIGLTVVFVAGYNEYVKNKKKALETKIPPQAENKE